MLDRFLNKYKNLYGEKRSRLFFWKRKREPVTFGRAISAVFYMSFHLAALARSLEATMSSVEPKFAYLGQELQSVYSDANELSQLTMKAARSIGGESDDGLLGNVGRLVRQSMEELRSCQTVISGNLRNLGVSAECLRDLYGMCAAVKKTAMFLNVAGMNVAVESSRSVESREMFAVFVQEIKQLAIRIIEISQSIHEDSMSAQSNQIIAHSKILKGLGRLRKLTDDADKVVQNAAMEIKQLMGLSLQALEQAGVHLQNISRQVDEIVVAIQFHDITRQQVEHIISALWDTVKLCREVTSSADPTGNKRKTLGRAHLILSFQVDQLKEVMSEIDAVYQKSMSAFGVIGNEIGRLAASASVLVLENEEKDPFVMLKSGFRGLYKLLGQGNDLGDQMWETVGQASKATVKLSHHVDQVRGISGVELHIKALNAIVKTAHLGEKGRVLEVLAQDVMRLSDESKRLVAEVVDILESITTTAEEQGGCSWKDEEETQIVGSTSRELLQVGIREISLTYEQIRKDSSMALQRSGDLQVAISQTKSGLDFLPELIYKLAPYINELEKMISLLNPWICQENDEIESEVDQVSQRYTMERERGVHKKVIINGKEELSEVVSTELAGEATREKTTEEHSGSAFQASLEKVEKEDDLGDNVELF